MSENYPWKRRVPAPEGGPGAVRDEPIPITVEELLARGVTAELELRLTDDLKIRLQREAEAS